MSAPGSPITAITALSNNTQAKFVVCVRDEEFTLRRSQLEFDAPNYFTAFFFGEFAESGSSIMHVDRNPELFSIIVEYMSGYNILPLSYRALPRTMDTDLALRNLAADAAFYGLSRLHMMLTSPRQPTIDFTWTGFSRRVVLFEDVLQGRLPESVSYTTSGLCSFYGGAVKPVIIFARNIALKLIGNRDFDNTGRPVITDPIASYRLCLTAAMKAQLEQQPYSAFEFCEIEKQSLIVSVLPESRLTINGSLVRFENFAHWWRDRVRRSPKFESVFQGQSPRVDEVEAERVFDEAFPAPVTETDWNDTYDRNDRKEFVLWGDELLFIITARGFLAGTLQLHVKLLDVKSRTRAEVLQSVRPLVVL